MKLVTLILTLLIGISCAHKTASRSPQSVGLPVTQITLLNSGNLEVNAGEKIKIKFALYDSLGTAVADKAVNFYFSGSNGRFEKSQIYSGINGEVENTFIAYESNEELNKRMAFEVYVDRSFLGRLTTTQFITVKSDPKAVALKKFNSVSLVTSSFEWVGDQNPMADPSKEYSLAFLPKDQSGTLIKSGGKFKINFISEGVSEVATFYTDNTYRLKVKGPGIFGKKSYKLEIRNEINESVHFIPEFLAEFKPVIKRDELKILKSEYDKNSYEVAFSVLDINGQVVTSEYLTDFLVIDESEKAVEFIKDGDIYSFKGEFPYGKGKKQFRFIANKEKMSVAIELPFNNLQLAWDKVEFLLDKTYVYPFFVKPASYDITQEMESVGVTLKLFDINGNPLTNLSDMNLSLETKVGRGVFSQLKLISPGAFKGQFSPENNEQGKIIFSLKGMEAEKELASELKIGFAPQKNLIGKQPDWTSSASSDELSIQLNEDENGKMMITGFSFENEGVNAVVPKGAACDSDPQDKLQAYRTYSFDFENQAKQAIRLYVRDNTSSWDSKNRHTSLYFFPRKFLPSFKKISNDVLDITLPTGEVVSLDRKSGQFISKNILEDLPVDMGAGYPQCVPGKAVTKRYPEINYKGKGIVLKVNNPTGSAMPEQPSREISAQVYYYDEITGKTVNCPKLLKTDFFTNGVLKFTSDEEVAKFLKLKCGEAFSKRIFTP